MTLQTEQPVNRPASRLAARLLTEIFAPPVLAAAMPLVVALDASRSVAAGTAWGLLAALFSALIPSAIIWYGVRRGRLTDHHVGVREQRRTPLLLGLASVLTGLAVLLDAGAPRHLVVMVVGMFLVLLVVTAVNQIWKLSVHAAILAASAALLVLVFGPALLVGVVVVVVAVCWSRVRLGDHTVGQVTAGAVAGTLLALVIYTTLW